MRVKGGQNVSRNLPKQLADVPLSARRLQFASLSEANVVGCRGCSVSTRLLAQAWEDRLAKDRSLVRAARPGLAAPRGV
jgi:hypothetical protein